MVSSAFTFKSTQLFLFSPCREKYKMFSVTSFKETSFQNRVVIITLLVFFFPFEIFKVLQLVVDETYQKQTVSQEKKVWSMFCRWFSQYINATANCECVCVFGSVIVLQSTRNCALRVDIRFCNMQVWVATVIGTYCLLWLSYHESNRMTQGKVSRKPVILLVLLWSSKKAAAENLELLCAWKKYRMV